MRATCFIAFLALVFLFAFEAKADVVKKSSSGICHCPGGSYYGRTARFTPYKTIDACLSSGGRHPRRGQGVCPKGEAGTAPSSVPALAPTPAPWNPATIKRKIEGKSSTIKKHEPMPRGVNLVVVDGDTLRVNGIRVRLRGIDAPESGQSCRDAKGKPYACGKWATEVLTLLAAGGARCELAGDERDRYGRWIADCFGAGGANINAAMVKAGYALAYRQYSMTYASQEDTARTSKKGMHQGRFVPPWEWRRGKRLK